MSIHASVPEGPIQGGCFGEGEAEEEGEAVSQLVVRRQLCWTSGGGNIARANGFQRIKNTSQSDVYSHDVLHNVGGILSC